MLEHSQNKKRNLSQSISLYINLTIRHGRMGGEQLEYFYGEKNSIAG